MSSCEARPSPPTLSTGMAQPHAPRPTWMWKPRSKLVGAEKSSSVSAFLKLRSIGAKQWRRRFVFVDKDCLCYGNEAGARDKVIHFESIQAADFASAAELTEQKAPLAFIDFGWYLHVDGRHLLLCAESKAAVDEWVHFAQTLLVHMRSLRAPGPSLPAPVAEMLPHCQPRLAAPTATTLPKTAAEPPLPRASPPPPLEAAASSAQAGGGDRDRSDGADAPSSTEDDFAMDGSPSGGEDADETDSHEGDFEGAGRAVSSAYDDTEPQFSRVSSFAESRNDSDVTDLLSASSEDTEGADEDDDGGASASESGHHASVQTASNTAVPSTMPDRSSGAEEKLAQYLLPIAQDTHSHIAFRVPSLSTHFKGGDTPQNVVFSRCLDKIGKRDNPQPRDLVLTPSYLYLFTRKHVGSGVQARCIATDQIVGVMVSSRDEAEMAVLVPSFHDVLLRVTPQNSRIGGSEVQVKEQLIAHLFKIHCMLGTGRRFVYRQVPDVRASIRRSTEDKHQPLATTPEDITHAASCSTLYPAFRLNGDSVVYWSSVVRLVRADRKPVLRVVVVTDGALFIVLDNLSKVVRRTSLDAIAALHYDADAQTILVQCTQSSDVLFSVQKDTDFDGILRVVPSVAQQTFGRLVRTTPSKQLYAHARLAPTDPTHSSGAVGAKADAARPKSGHHTLSRQLKTLWKAGMGKESRYEAHAIKATAEDDSDGDGDGDPLHPHSPSSGNKSRLSAEQALYGLYRFVEEVVLDYEDEVQLLQATPAHPGAWDSLGVLPRFTTSQSTGAVLFSTPCYVFEDKAVNVLSKSNKPVPAGNLANTKSGLCVTTLGVLLVKGIHPAPPQQATVTDSFRANEGGSGGGALGGLGGKAGRLLRGATSRATATDAAAGTASPSSLPSLQAHVQTQLVWTDIVALVRCRVGQTPVVGIMTTRSQQQDYLVELPSEQAMLDLMTAAAQSYASRRVTKAGSVVTFGGSLPLFATPRAANVARALKKTLFDPFPTVSLRHTAASYNSDALRMAVVPEVADVCRRFGDNTIFFSGVAWRIRSATLRHENGVITEDPGPRLCRHNNNLYKSYILLVTNCAIYHCAKGGFEVMRRTSLLDVESVYISTSDPDTIMLTVPSEYDMYFRVEGRGAEFLERLTEAYMEWTNYAWYRPHERQGTHRVKDYFVPVHRVAPVATHGQLTKPPTFNALQASRSPISVRTKSLRWHERRLEAALSHFEKALEVGRTGLARNRSREGSRENVWSRQQQVVRSSAAKASAARGSHHGGALNATASTTRTLTWPQVRDQLALAQSLLYFTQRRCFRAGLRGDECAAMTRAQIYLAQYARLQKVVKQLESVVITANMDAYEQLLNEASAYPELNVLIAEQSSQYTVFRRKQQAVKAVVALAMEATEEDLGDPEDGVLSVSQALPELVQKIDHAVTCGVERRTVHLLIAYVDVLAQRDQLTRCLDSADGKDWLLSPSAQDAWARPLRRTLVQVVARCLCLPLPRQCTSPPPAREATTDSHAQESLSAAPPLALGLGYLLYQSQYDWVVAVVSQAEQSGFAPSSWVTEQMEAMRALTARGDDKKLLDISVCIAQHQRHQDWTRSEVRRLYTECKTLSRRTPTGTAAFALVHDVLQLHMDALAVRHDALARRAEMAQREKQARHFYEEEAARQAALEAQAQAHRVRREQTAHARRRDAFYGMWTARVERLRDDLRHATQGAVNCDAVRLVGRQCAQLQVELNQTVDAYRQHFAALPSDESTAATEPADKTRLTEQITDVSEAVRDFLIREAHDGVNPYAPSTSSRIPASATRRGASDSPDVHVLEGEASTSVEPTPAPVLPPDLLAAIDGCDADAVALYVQQHEDEITEACAEAVRTRWRAGVAHAEWVRRLHRGVDAAITLCSPALLQWQLSLAAEKTYTDETVARASQLWADLHAAASLEVQNEIWRQANCTDSAGAATPVAFPNPSSASYVSSSSSPSPSSSPASASSLADSDIHLDSEPSDHEGADADRTLAVSDHDEEGIDVAADHASAASTPSPSPPASSLDAFVRMRFPQLHWPSPSEVVEEVTGGADQDNMGALSLDVCRALETVILRFLLHPHNTLHGAPEEDACTLVSSADNPHLPDLIFHWMQVWTCGLRPEGVVRKTPRYATDVIERVAARQERDGQLLAPYANRLVGLFLKAGRFQTVRGPASDFAFLAYMMQERAMEDVLLETSRLLEKEKMKLMDAAAPLRHVSLLGNLLALAHVCRSVVVPYDVRQPAQLQQLLVSAANASSPPPQQQTVPAAAPVPEAQRPTTPQRPSPSHASSQAPAAATCAETPADARRASALCGREALMRSSVEAMRRAVQALTLYFRQEVATLAPPHETNSITTLQALFDEHAHPAIIPVLAKQVEPALLALLEAGFQSRYQLIRTRTLRDLLEHFAEHLRESSRSLVGVDIVGAVELMAALTDGEGRYKQQLDALSEIERGRVCMRIFLRQCLNRRCLAEMLEALFPSEEEDPEWGGEDGVWSFYDKDMCVLFPREAPQVASLFSVLRSLSQFPFSLAIDRALW